MAKKKEDMAELRSEKMVSAVESVVRKFEDDKIKERKGQGGKMFKYVQAQEYIVRLNDIFGLAWSCEIVNHWFVNNSVVMWVRIHYPNIDYPDAANLREYKDGIDAHPLSADVGNAFKAAYLKAFRKAAAQIGAGLHLWGIISEDDEDIDGGYQYQAGGPLPPNVIPVNPGLQNPPVAPGAPPVPQAAVYPPPPVANPAMPPVPAAMPPVPVGQVPTPAPPQFVNPQVPNGSVAPPPAPAPLPPLPTGNPNPGVDTSGAVGVTAGPGTEASASLGFTTAPAPPVPPQAGGQLADYMVNGVKGAAVTRGLQDPMDLVRQVLGNEASSIPAVENLTFEQAQRILEAVRQMPPQ